MFFFVLVALVFAYPAQAQKLYKIVDKDGNVSFSQFPPVEKKEDVTVDDIHVASDSQSSITDGLDGKYCGNIKLLDKSASRYKTSTYVKNLDSKRESWRRQLDQLNQAIDRNNQNAINRSKYQQSNSRYQESIASNTEKLRDLRCALDWVDDELDGKSDLIAANKQERQRLEAIKSDLQAKLDSNCGELPTYDPGALRNKEDRQRWYKCSDDLRREMRRVDSAIGKL